MSKKITVFLTTVLLMLCLSGCDTSSSTEEEALYTYEPSPNTNNEFESAISPEDMVVLMGKGTNLGNILEMPDDWQWLIPEEEYYFDDFQSAGFKNVRIPVNWGNHMDGQGNIDPAFMTRVETVVDWSLERGFITIINVHHEAWVYNSYSANIDKLEKVWTQIADRFQYKSENLVFEIFNEPRAPMGTSDCNDMNNRILPIIRVKNPQRVVLIGGTHWGSYDYLMQIDIPEDDYLMAQFHFYNPHHFSHESTFTWGSAEEIATMRDQIASVATWGADNHIPLYCGEYGVMHANEENPKDMDSVLLYFETLVNTLEEHGIASSLWDDAGWFHVYDRHERTYNEILDQILP